MKMFDAVQWTPSWILSRRVSSFQRFFELGQEESSSPFLDEQAKRISRNLMLKSSMASACLLAFSGLLRLFVVEPWWPLPLAIVYLLVGTPALIAAARDVIERYDVNIDVLTTVAAFGALVIGSPLEGALLLVLFALSGSLEDMVTLKAKSALCAIDEIAPTKASVIGQGGRFMEKSVADVKVGESVAVRAGEVVPLDGLIRKGEALISMAHMTGESRPLFVGVDQVVLSGARVLDGFIEVQVQLLHGDSTVAKLIGLITRAHSTKPKLSVTFDRWGRLYAISVMLCAFFLLFFFPVVVGLPWLGDEGSIVRSVSFLITASPCALILAVPITYLSALGATARRGAILKGSMILDQVVKCGVVAFDKTGTLTEGFLALEEIVPLTQGSTFSEKEVLAFAAALERHAVHPIAHSIIEAFLIRNEPFPSVDDVHVIPGEGVRGVVVIDGEKKSLFIGKAEVALRSVHANDPRCMIDEKRLEGKAVAALSVPGYGAYLIVFGDRIRSESADVVARLKALDKRVMMLTGDGAKNAKMVGDSLGVDEVFSSLVPEQKLELISTLSHEKGVLMVGDGINDAPALARATVGVSMGQLSSASAREASDIVLLHNNLDVLVWIFEKALMTRHIVFQNLLIAGVAMTVGITGSLLGFFPLWMAVTIHEGSTLIVGMNALRLLALHGGNQQSRR